jgi:hypothetical protein
VRIERFRAAYSAPLRIGVFDIPKGSYGANSLANSLDCAMQAFGYYCHRFYLKGSQSEYR